MSNLRAYLRLVRIPNLFTVPGDALAGAALAGAAGGDAWSGAALAAGCGTLVYLGGMAFNDVLDRDEDAAERPDRPIPSGQVTLSGAISVGALLHAAGLGLALLAGPQVAATAAVLVLATFVYNGPAKSGPAAPFVMGLCRALDLLLGAVAVGWHPVLALDAAPAPAVGALLLLSYVGVITRTASGEVSGATPRAAMAAGIGFGTVLVAGPVVAGGGLLPSELPAVVPWAALATVLGRAVVRMGRDPSAPQVIAVIKTSVMGIVLLDASLVAAAGQPVIAAALVAGLAPALWLGKRFHST